MDWLEQINGWVWGPVLLGLLIGTGVYLSILLRGLQFRKLGTAFRLAFFAKGEGKGDISPFQALTTALSATIGTGNIAGVATAITIGGLGAIFWMWVTGLIGMVIKYVEAILAVRYRVENKNGEMAGGPMYVLHRALNWRWLAVLFALFGILASFGIGNLVQVHSIADVLETIGMPRFASAIVLAAIVGVMVIGGIKSIGKVTSIVVPAMAAFYLIGGLVIIFMHLPELPMAIWNIIRMAFTGQAMVGGFLGSSAMMAMRMGVSRGLFSNEAGLGTSGIAAAAARTREPVEQGLIQMSGAFIDTLIVCTVTGLVLAVTGVLGTRDVEGVMLNGAPLTAYAFESTLPGSGWVVAIGLVLFAYTTVLGWAYYGEKCFEYLLGSAIRYPYRVIFSLAVLIGAFLPLQTVWNFADIANGLMAYPNLIALLALAGVSVTETRRYFQEKLPC